MTDIKTEHHRPIVAVTGASRGIGHAIVRPEEVAEVVHFLASTQSSYVTGSEIPINGGQHI